MKAICRLSVIVLFLATSFFPSAERMRAAAQQSPGAARARADYENAVKVVKAWLKEHKDDPIDYPKEIPTFLPTCEKPQPDKAYLDARKDYIESFLRPEQDLATGTMLMIKDLPAEEKKAAYEEVSPYLKTLMGRVNQRALQAIRDVSREPDHGEAKLSVLVEILLSMQRQLQLAGGGPGTPDDFGPEAAYKELGVLLRKMADDELARIADEHDFYAVQRAFRLVREASMLGADVGDFLEKIIDALRFRIHIEEAIEGGPFKLTLEGDVDVFFRQIGQVRNPGVMKYTYGHSEDAEAAETTADLVPGQSFEVQVAVTRLDQMFAAKAGSKCDSIELTFDRLGAETEDWKLTSGERMQLNVADRVMRAVFTPEPGKDFSFTLPFHNKREVLVEEALVRPWYDEESEHRYKVRLAFKVTHTPRRRK